MIEPSSTERELESALLSLDRSAARSILTAHRTAGTPFQLIEGVITPVLERIGEGWEHGRVALSQVYMAGRICEDLVDELLLPADVDHRSPEMAIVVLEDYHMLGKRIVTCTLRSSGFHLADYGQMGVRGCVDRVKEDGIKILLISTLMLPSALKVENVREELDRAGMKVKIMVGVAPFRFDDRLWEEVGANASASTASGAIEIVNRVWKEIG
jgi:methanogenic corrinoid protein MtbC1